MSLVTNINLRLSILLILSMFPLYIVNKSNSNEADHSCVCDLAYNIVSEFPNIPNKDYFNSLTRIMKW